MQVYQTNAEGLFAGVTTADLSPLEEGVWIIPGGCVTVQPPEFQAGQQARWTGDAWVIEPVPPAPTEEEPIDERTPQQKLMAHAALRRWMLETGGIMIGGIPVSTDDRSKIMIMGARVAAQANPDWSTTWHGADGASYPLNAASMVAISDAVEAHVNSTFATFALVKGDIDAGTITSTEQIDAAFS